MPETYGDTHNIDKSIKTPFHELAEGTKLACASTSCDIFVR